MTNPLTSQEQRTIAQRLKALESKWDDRAEGWSEGAREASVDGIDDKPEHDKYMAAMNAIDQCINDVRALRTEWATPSPSSADPSQDMLKHVAETCARAEAELEAVEEAVRRVCPLVDERDEPEAAYVAYTENGDTIIEADTLNEAVRQIIAQWIAVSEGHPSSAEMIARFDLVDRTTAYTTDRQMEPCEDGEWVRWEDVRNTLDASRQSARRDV